MTSTQTDTRSESVQQDEPRIWDKPWSPPPWSAVEEDGVWQVVCDGYEDETPIVCCGSGTWPLTEAGARMIAAGPDLLEALKRAVADELGDDWKRDARSAISRATTQEGDQ